MASAGSTRSLLQNRQHRLIWCLALPSILRPMFASDARSTRMAEATSAASVLAWDSRSEQEQTETTHAIASVRCMIDAPCRLCLGGPPEPVTAGSAYFMPPRATELETGDESAKIVLDSAASSDMLGFSQTNESRAVRRPPFPLSPGATFSGSQIMGLVKHGWPFRAVVVAVWLAGAANAPAV